MKAPGFNFWNLKCGDILVYKICFFKLNVLYRYVAQCLAGEKIICLCITEPGAGSDVSNLACTAKDMGDHYLVEGNKKWITNGIYADYFTVAVRTGPPGSAHKAGLSHSLPGIRNWSHTACHQLVF